jgi:hypothetical protein
MYFELYYKYSKIYDDGYSEEIVDLFDSNNNIIGLLESKRDTNLNKKIININNTFNPYNVHKIIHIKEGLIEFKYNVIENLSVECRPIYATKTLCEINNIKREILSNESEEFIRGKITLTL